MIKREQKRRRCLQCGARRRLIALGVGQAVLQHKAEAQGASVTGADVRSRSAVAEAAAESLGARLDHRRLGRRAGSRLDHPSRRRRRCTTTRAAPSSIRRSPSAAHARRRSSSSTRTATWCGTGAVPGRATSGRESNHGIYVDYKGNVWIGGNGEQGRAHPEVHQGRQVPDAGRRASARTPAATISENFGRVAKIFVDPKTNEAYIADGYLQQARRGDRRRHRQDEALLGRLRQQAGRHQPRPLQSDGAAGAAVPQPGALRRALERRARLRLRSRRTTALQVFQPDGKFVKEAFYAKNTLRRRLGLGHRVLEGSRSRSIIYPGRRPEREGPHHRARDAGGADQLRRRRTPARPVLRRAQHRDRFEGQPLHDRNLRREARCRSSSTRASARCRAAIRASSGRSEAERHDLIRQVQPVGRHRAAGDDGGD